MSSVNGRGKLAILVNLGRVQEMVHVVHKEMLWGDQQGWAQWKKKKKKQKIIQKPDWDSNKMENIFNPHLQVHQEEKHVWLSPEMHINSELIQILPWFEGKFCKGWTIEKSIILPFSSSCHSTPQSRNRLACTGLKEQRLTGWLAVSSF